MGITINTYDLTITVQELTRSGALQVTNVLLQWIQDASPEDRADLQKVNRQIASAYIYYSPVRITHGGIQLPPGDNVITVDENTSLVIPLPMTMTAMDNLPFGLAMQWENAVMALNRAHTDFLSNALSMWMRQIGSSASGFGRKL